MGGSKSRNLKPDDVVKDYKIVESLDSGAFGDVYKVVELESSEQKTFALKKIKSNQDNSFVNEIKYLKETNHKNVVQYINCFIDNFTTPYIVMEYCECGSIDKFLKERKPNEKSRMGFIQDIANGVAHIHRRGIVHRDLKPANILINSKHVAKIADFGLAKKVFNPDATKFRKFLSYIYMKTHAGTYPYMAPEVFRGHYNFKADIFSMGIIFCVVLDDELKEYIENELIGCNMYWYPSSYSFKVPSTIEESMRSLIADMLKKDGQQRPTAYDITQRLICHTETRQGMGSVTYTPRNKTYWDL